MNNNIQEDYCSFEVSKLLKEKGFDVSSTWYFLIKDSCKGVFGKLNIGERRVNMGAEVDMILIKNGNYAYQPTHSLAIKWIRENFGIHIKLDWFTDEEKSIDWDFSIQKIGTDIDERGNSEYLRDYDVETGFNTPEEATEAALLYTLKNLI